MIGITCFTFCFALRLRATVCCFGTIIWFTVDEFTCPTGPVINGVRILSIVALIYIVTNIIIIGIKHIWYIVSTFSTCIIWCQTRTRSFKMICSSSIVITVIECLAPQYFIIITYTITIGIVIYNTSVICITRLTYSIQYDTRFTSMSGKSIIIACTFCHTTIDYQFACSVVIVISICTFASS